MALGVSRCTDLVSTFGVFLERWTRFLFDLGSTSVFIDF